MKAVQIITLVLVGVLVVSVFGGAYWYLWGPCGKQLTEQAWSEIRPAAADWFAGYYAKDVRAMQRAHAASNAIPVPACMRDTMHALNEAMESTINAQISMDNGDMENSLPLTSAPTAAKYAGIELERIAQCAPFCK
jgi:hypothetical protein